MPAGRPKGSGTKTKNTVVGFRPGKELRQAILKEADTRGLSIASTVRSLLAEELKRIDQKILR